MEHEASPTSHWYVSQRLRLHYLDWGNADAPPLLLIHGNRDHCHNWDWVARRFRDRYHVVAPDLRGHGDSQWAVGSTYTQAEWVYDIAQLVHQLQLAPVTIVAHSLGGGVALTYAGTFPEEVAKLVVVEGFGPPPLPPERQRTPAERLREFVESGRSLAGRHPRRYASLEDAYRRMHEANQHLSPEQARHLTVHGSNQNEDGTYSWKFDNYVHIRAPFDITVEERRAMWRDVGCPVLLVSGEESWSRRHDLDDDVTSHFEQARHEVIAGAGHWPHHDQIDTFVGLVDGFLGA